MSILKNWVSDRKERDEAIRREVAEMEASTAVGAEAYTEPPTQYRKESAPRFKCVPLDAEMVASVAGGVREGEPLRDICEYIEAGIQVQRVDMNLPELFFMGRRISTQEANRIVDFNYSHGRCPTEAELGR